MQGNVTKINRNSIIKIIIIIIKVYFAVIK